MAGVGSQLTTYALSPMTGSNIMKQLNLYSGNLSSVPHGDVLSQQYDSTDYVRLWATISTGRCTPNISLDLTDVYI
jgi:hypothetical protein